MVQSLEQPFRIRYESFSTLAQAVNLCTSLESLTKIVHQKLKYIFDCTLVRISLFESEGALILMSGMGYSECVYHCHPLEKQLICFSPENSDEKHTKTYTQLEIQSDPVLRNTAFNSPKIKQFVGRYIPAADEKSFTICVGKMQDTPYTEVDYQFIQLVGELVGNRMLQMHTTQKLYDINTALEEARKEAEISVNAKATFLAAMSHEIRTPLNGILGMAQALKLEELPPHIASKIDTIVSSGKGLLNILNDILDMSKINAGKIHVEKIPLSLPTLMQDVKDLLQVTADKKDIILKTFFEKETTPAFVFSDPGRLRQILLNLTGNAIKFTESGSVTIQFKGKDWNKKTNQATLIVDVIDTGIGIPEEALEKIFDPFSQAEGDTTRRFGGTGLGLPISKKLIELLGGALTVKSVLGKGTTFTMILPLETTEPIQQETKQQDITKIYPLNILVVDDNIVNLQVAKALLSKDGHNIITAENGAEAINLLTTHKTSIDVIFMDLHMPVKDGIEATRDIRNLSHKRLAKVPILGLTADVFKEKTQQCMDAGMDDVLQKPIQIETTRQKLANLSCKI